MKASHASLRDDMEVSCAELDILVEAALRCGPKAVLGSRMTGGGFGGCTVSLVRKSELATVMERMRCEYATRCGGRHAAEFYVAEPGRGARMLVLEDE